MADEDVIELGSSDDEEASPRPPAMAAANKAKRRHNANAMVNIPQTIHGVTIKPTKSAKPLPKQSYHPGNIRTVHPMASTIRPIITGNLNNQTTIKPVPSNRRNNLSSTPRVRTANSKPFAIPTSSTANINPMSLMKNLNKSQVVINRVVATSTPKISVVKSLSKIKQRPTPQSTPNPMARLPPSVTITKTSRQIKQAPVTTNIASLAKKPKGNNTMVPIKVPVKHIYIPSKPKPSPKPNKANIKINVLKSKTLSVKPLCQGNILTVELDDDTDSPSTSTANNPSWYLRPEVHTNKDAVEMEKLNNAEPEPQFIEICIEDSPVSKPKNRRASELNDSITIDDSPKHSTPKKRTRDSESDDEHRRNKTPKTKKRKKLDYHTEVPLLDKSIEIEIDPIQIDQNVTAVDTIGQVEIDPIAIPEKMDTDKEPAIEVIKTHNKSDERVSRDYSVKNNIYEATATTANEPVSTKKLVVNAVDDTVIEILESPVKKKKGPHSRKGPHSKPKLLEKIPEVEDSEEFHPIYQKFINICLELDQSSDMKTIVEKKIKGYYKQVPKEYTYSEDFIEMVSSKILSMTAGKDKMYLYIKDVVDELNVQRKIAKCQLLQKETERKESGKLEFTDDSEFDSKRQRQIRKLEKTLRKLHRAIQKLEEQEVDFDDEEDSVYLLTERYKERMVRVHAKLCQLTNTKLPSEPLLHIESRPGQPTGPAKRLEKWINQKVPMGKPLPFPDFHDVLRMVREANNEDKLGWNEADIMEEARDLFTRCGKKLQRRRQEVEWRIAASRLPVDIDPAEVSDDLKNKLEHNRLLASKKEIDLFNKYADRQSEMRLEGEEINDKEAEESPIESEDDDAVEEVALSDKEKRKERLKRLIQEKSYKKNERKEIFQSINEEIKENSGKESAEEVITGDTATLKKVKDVQLNPGLDPSAITIEIQMEDAESEVVADSKTVLNDSVMEIENEKNNDDGGKENVPMDMGKKPTVQEKDLNDKEKDPTAEMESDVTEKNVDGKSSDKTSKSDSDNKSQETAENCDTDTKSLDKSKTFAADTKLDEEIEINSVSDESEVHEMKLLEKLYKENDDSSSESDLDSPIDISDSAESDDAKENNTNNEEIFSIENSSESDTRDSNGKDNTNEKCSSVKQTPQLDAIQEIESSNDAMESLIYNDDDDSNSGDGCENKTDKEKLIEGIKPLDPLKIDIDSTDKAMNVTQPDNIVEDSNVVYDRKNDDDNRTSSTSVPVSAPNNEMIPEKNKSAEEILEKPKSANDDESLQLAIDSLQSNLPDNDNPKSIYCGSEISSSQVDIWSSGSELQSGSQTSLISIGKTVVQGQVVDDIECENGMSFDDVTGNNLNSNTETLNDEEVSNKSDENNIKVPEDISVPIAETVEDKDYANDKKTDQTEQSEIEQAKKDHSERDESMSDQEKTIETTVLISTQAVTNTDVEEKTIESTDAEVNQNDMNEDLGENLMGMEVDL